MAEPLDTESSEKIQNITPAEKIIESLVPPTTAPSVTEASSELDIEPSVELLPLTDDEIIPTAGEVKNIVGRSMIWVGSFAIVIAVSVLALQLIPKSSVRLPVDAVPEKEAVQVPVQTAPVPAPIARPVKRVQAPPAPVQTASVPSVPPEAAVPTAIIHPLPIPGNLKARFDSPEMVELNWDFVGDTYKYRLYSASTDTMTDAQPETDLAIIPPHMIWQPRRQTRTMWIAVSSIDPQGRESQMSAPLHINLPPAL